MKPATRVGLAASVALVCFLLGHRGAEIASRSARPPAGPPDATRARTVAVLMGHDPVAQSLTLAPLFVAAQAADLDRITALYEEVFPRGGGSGLALDLLVEAMATADPVAAFQRIEAWPVDRRQEAMPELIHTWARLDPKTAEEILDQVTDPDTRPRAFLKFIGGWWSSGDPRIWSYLAEAPNSMSREQASYALLRREFAAHGIDATIAKIEALPDPEFTHFRPAALKTAIGMIARVQPERAAEIVADHRDDAIGDLLSRRLVVNWVALDPPAAMAWILSEPPSKHRDRVSREAYRRWIGRDRSAALAWMDARDGYAGLGALTDMYATARARDDLPGAIEWTAQLEDPEMRREARLDLAEVWQPRDPEAAETWVREMGLEAELEARRARRGDRRGRGRERRTR
jgi:hypothetical protein